MASTIHYRSISSQTITQVANKMGLTTNIISQDDNLYTISSSTISYLFKSTDFGGNTSLAYKIADNKIVSNTVLKHYGYPIAKSIIVTRKQLKKFNKNNLHSMTYPLVVKPTHESHGNGVMMNILTYDDLKERISTSLLIYDTVLVQEQIPGDEYRVLIVQGDVLVVENRIPPLVIGDGKSSIEELVDQENQNSLRGKGYNKPFAKILLDDEADAYIASQGYVHNDILPSEHSLTVRGNSNTGTGSWSKNCTHLIAKETKNSLIQLCEQLGFAICGVDIITSDISRPLAETGGVILELNATPGIGGYQELFNIDIAKKILEKLF